MPYRVVGATTDPARPEGERDDCAVWALSHALSVSYATAHATLAAQGRTVGQGTLDQHWKVAASVLGYHVESMNSSLGIFQGVRRLGKYSDALGPFASVYDEGIYLISTCRTRPGGDNPSHLMAVVDGVVYDSGADAEWLNDWPPAKMSHARQRVWSAWRLLPVRAT